VEPAADRWQPSGIAVTVPDTIRAKRYMGGRRVDDAPLWCAHLRMSHDDAPRSILDILWLMLPEQRPYRELHWLSMMPNARVTAAGEPRPAESVAFSPHRYRRLTRRFVEAGALAWLADLDAIATPEWVASLELCSLVTGQASGLRRRRGCRQAVLVWGNIADNPLYKIPPYRQALDRTRGADLFLCFVESAREHCIALGLPEERCPVVLPGVDVDLFRPPPLPVSEPVAIFVSPLAPNKGIDRTLDAFTQVRRRLPDARLRIAGRGPLEGLVREHERTTNGAVEYLGALPREAVATALQTSAVFVTAPRPTRVWNEQFGLAYVEAMACGLPVVTTICGSNHEAVRPPNLRVEDDVGALAEGLYAFLADPERRAEVGRENREVATTHHDLRTQTRAMRAAFDTVS
jgi:glycosyltransferase involved in cell wall biosynthesis